MKKFLLTSLVPLIFGACSTDFDVIAPYKEIIVIDGLLNVADTVQSVRISKAYLGEGDATVMAQQSDSINYGDVLKVTMTKVSSGQSFDLVRSEQNIKDSGMFAYPLVILYTTNHPIDQNSNYKIEVTNTSTGVTASSETKIVGNVNVSPPIPEPVNYDNDEDPVFVTYDIGNNSFVHELRLRFHYRERDPNGVSTLHTVNWNLNAPASLVAGEAKYIYYLSTFYTLLQNNIPDAPSGYVRRIDSLGSGIKPIEYIFVEGSEDLQTYIELNKPATGVVTERPLFTTVTNGIGLFSSRLVSSEFRNLSPSMINFMDNCSYLANKGFEF